jgi:hypothetical protein
MIGLPAGSRRRDPPPVRHPRCSSHRGPQRRAESAVSARETRGSLRDGPRLAMPWAGLISDTRIMIPLAETTENENTCKSALSSDAVIPRNTSFRGTFGLTRVDPWSFLRVSRGSSSRVGRSQGAWVTAYLVYPSAAVVAGVPGYRSIRRGHWLTLSDYPVHRAIRRDGARLGTFQSARSSSGAQARSQTLSSASLVRAQYRPLSRTVGLSPTC